MMIPMSAREPPWSAIKSGNRKKPAKLDVVQKFARAIMTKERV